MLHSFYGPDTRRLSSIVTPSDLAEETWLNGKSLIASIGETLIVLNLCPDAINMNSVLVIFEEVCLLLTNCEHSVIPFYSVCLSLSCSLSLAYV